MQINKKKIVIQILATVGLILTIKLAMIYYVANYEKYALSSFCSINDFIDCDGAAKSDLAQFFGIPLAYWGMLFYIIILFLTFVDKLKNIKFLGFLKVFKDPDAYITFLGSIAFLISMIIAGISLFSVKKLCVLCVVTYFIDFIIALVSSDRILKNIVHDFKITFIDFIAGVKNYTKTFIVLMIIAVSFLCYSGITLNLVPHVKKRNEIMKYRKIKHNPYRVKGNVLGNPNGNVVIYLYSDYVCPMCYIHNIMIHQAVKEYKNINVHHYNFPFDKECNPYISVSMHPDACFMWRGAIAAKNQGNYWEMSSLLYEKQPKDMKSMLKLAKKLHFDEDRFIKDFQSKETTSLIQAEVKNGNMRDIDATPTMFINGKKYVGIRTYKKLQEILENHGAVAAK